MGWKISDLFPLVICQVRNHGANNDFSLWSEEFISVRPKALLGSEATNLKGHTVFYLRAEAQVCLMMLW